MALESDAPEDGEDPFLADGAAAVFGVVAQLGLDLVEPLDFEQDQRGERAFVASFVKLATRVCPAGSVFDPCSGMTFPERPAGGIVLAEAASLAETMRRTIRLAQKHGVAIGAHPGYPGIRNVVEENLSLLAQLRPG